jgi:hypothetical protein
MTEIVYCARRRLICDGVTNLGIELTFTFLATWFCVTYPLTGSLPSAS